MTDRLLRRCLFFSIARRLGLALCLGVCLADVLAHADEVRLRDGTSLMGRLSVEADSAVIVLASGATRRLPWADVERIRQDPSPSAPAPQGEAREALAAEFQRRLSALPAEDVSAAEELARWAAESGLEEPALQAWRLVLERDLDHAEAHRALGEVVHEGAWMPAAQALDERREALGETPKASKLYGLSEWFRTQEAPAEEYRVLVELLRLDPFHRDGLRRLRPYTDTMVQQVDAAFPLAGRWRAQLDKTRHHQKKAYAVYALDFVRLDRRGKHHRSRGRRLRDHHAWEQPVFAVADGLVVAVHDGYRDLPVGKAGKSDNANGCVVLHDGGDHSLYLHLKKGSLAVKLHQRVQRGDLLGEVGNSGASGMPHLHFAMSRESAQVSIPMWFSGYVLERGDHQVAVDRGRIQEGDIVIGPERDR